MKGNDTEAGMKHAYPEPEDVGIKIPLYLLKEKFRKGFSHALQGRQLKFCEHLKLSFREGYRAGKLFLNQVRQQSNIIEFPFKGHADVRVSGPDVV